MRGGRFDLAVQLQGKIAAELGLAEKTVKNYVASILQAEGGPPAEAAAYLPRHTSPASS